MMGQLQQSRMVLSTTDLEAFDPGAPGGGPERRFLCPISDCGRDKPRDSKHRSLCVNVRTGAWFCQRCKARGRLADECYKACSTPHARHLWRRQAAQRFALPSDLHKHTVVPEKADTYEKSSDWRVQLAGARLIEDERSAVYLLSRGIGLRTACLSAILLAPNFYGKPAVVFPLRDFEDHMTGASGRYFHQFANPKTRIAGKRRGVFTAPVIDKSGRVSLPFTNDVPGVIITEAPMDALSLATAGYPAIALCGTSAPDWIHLACGLKRVLLAFDADAAGDKAATELATSLSPYGARCERLRPYGAKDWNEVLQKNGSYALKEWLGQKT